MKTTAEILTDGDPLEMEWVDLELTEGNSHIRIRVTTDAVKFEGRRLPVSIQQHQQIASAHDAFLPTAKLLDVIHARADVRVPAVYLTDRLGHNADASVRIDEHVTQAVMELAAGGAKRLIDGREQPLVSNVGLSWVLSERWRYDGKEYEYAQHGIYDKHASSISPVMPWQFRCHFADQGAASGDSSSLHFARLVQGEVEIGVAHGRTGGLTWVNKRLDWALMHTVYAPLLHQGPLRLTWTAVPNALPTPAR